MITVENGVYLQNKEIDGQSVADLLLHRKEIHSVRYILIRIEHEPWLRNIFDS